MKVHKEYWNIHENYYYCQKFINIHIIQKVNQFLKNTIPSIWRKNRNRKTAKEKAPVLWQTGAFIYELLMLVEFVGNDQLKFRNSYIELLLINQSFHEVGSIHFTYFRIQVTA